MGGAVASSGVATGSASSDSMEAVEVVDVGVVENKDGEVEGSPESDVRGLELELGEADADDDHEGEAVLPAELGSRKRGGVSGGVGGVASNLGGRTVRRTGAGATSEL